MFDELGRYADNEYPRSGIFTQNEVEVKFESLPDFRIKKVAMDPRNPEVGEEVEITVTVENIGNADWSLSVLEPLSVIFEDGTGYEKAEAVSEAINQADTTEVKFIWTVPDEDNKDELTLTWTIDAGTGNFEIKQCDTCDDSSPGGGTDNDEYTDEDTDADAHTDVNTNAYVETYENANDGADAYADADAHAGVGRVVDLRGHRGVRGAGCDGLPRDRLRA